MLPRGIQPCTSGLTSQHYWAKETCPIYWQVQNPNIVIVITLSSCSHLCGGVTLWQVISILYLLEDDIFTRVIPSQQKPLFLLSIWSPIAVDFHCPSILLFDDGQKWFQIFWPKIRVWVHKGYHPKVLAIIDQKKNIRAYMNIRWCTDILYYLIFNGLQNWVALMSQPYRVEVDWSRSELKLNLSFYIRRSMWLSSWKFFGPT